MRHPALGALAVLTVFGLCIFAGPQPAAAQMYRWTDDEGETHFTEGPESVPLKFRRKAVLMGETAQPVASPPGTPAGSGAPSAPAGGARIQFTPGQKIIVDARLNGRGPARLILDTGATSTLINPLVLTALGVSFQSAQPARGRGIGGTVEGFTVRVDSIDVGGARHGPLRVFAHDGGLGLDADGLLGRDFLDNFSITIDNSAAVLVLAPKQSR